MIHPIDIFVPCDVMRHALLILDTGYILNTNFIQFLVYLATIIKSWPNPSACVLTERSGSRVMEPRLVAQTHHTTHSNQNDNHTDAYCIGYRRTVYQRTKYTLAKR
jgi:hypothetical protein